MPDSSQKVLRRSGLPQIYYVTAALQSADRRVRELINGTFTRAGIVVIVGASISEVEPFAPSRRVDCKALSYLFTEKTEPASLFKAIAEHHSTDPDLPITFLYKESPILDKLRSDFESPQPQGIFDNIIDIYSEYLLRFCSKKMSFLDADTVIAEAGLWPKGLIGKETPPKSDTSELYKPFDSREQMENDHIALLLSILSAQYRDDDVYFVYSGSPDVIEAHKDEIAGVVTISRKILRRNLNSRRKKIATLAKPAPVPQYTDFKSAVSRQEELLEYSGDVPIFEGFNILKERLSSTRSTTHGRIVLATWGSGKSSIAEKPSKALYAATEPPVVKGVYYDDIMGSVENPMTLGSFYDALEASQPRADGGDAASHAAKSLNFGLVHAVNGKYGGEIDPTKLATGIFKSALFGFSNDRIIGEGHSDAYCDLCRAVFYLMIKTAPYDAKAKQWSLFLPQSVRLSDRRMYPDLIATSPWGTMVYLPTGKGPQFTAVPIPEGLFDRYLESYPYPESMVRISPFEQKMGAMIKVTRERSHMLHKYEYVLTAVGKDFAHDEARPFGPGVLFVYDSDNSYLASLVCVVGEVDLKDGVPPEPSRAHEVNVANLVGQVIFRPAVCYGEEHNPLITYYQLLNVSTVGCGRNAPPKPVEYLLSKDLFKKQGVDVSGHLFQIASMHPLYMINLLIMAIMNILKLYDGRNHLVAWSGQPVNWHSLSDYTASIELSGLLRLSDYQKSHLRFISDVFKIFESKEPDMQIVAASHEKVTQGLVDDLCRMLLG